ncbi:MAG TPA: 4-hydroxy-tetrahydrodipicolinate reductase [Steroidobacteraceae bacterium]
MRAVLIGVTGRMGRELLHAAPGFAQLIITGAIASPASLALGRDAGEVAGLGPLNLPVTSELGRALTEADVAIDFSSPSATRTNLRACRAARKPLLICTTGFGAELDGELTSAARDIALLVAANTSIGVTLLLELVRIAARALPPGFDIDVLDVHHRLKQDAPSGTALALGAAAREARRLPRSSRADAATAGEAGGGSSRARTRREGEIGFAAVRAGDIVGEHTVLFAGPGEQLTLTHRATDRGIFARGALAAALWLQSQPPGRYTMGDILGQKTGT